MEKIKKVIKWSLENFFRITIVATIIIYLRWFWLTPLVFEYYNDPNGAFLVGIILFIIYLAFAVFFRLLRHGFLKYFTLATAVMLALINIGHIYAFFPMIENRINCNGKIYYITWMHPFGDYQWTFDQLTIWDGIRYESQFFGYSQGPFEIICDEEKGMANIVRTENGVITYSHGKKSVPYDNWAGAQLEGSRYFLAWKCNEWGDSTCESETYTLHECSLEYKSCDPLFISYTDEHVSTLVLESNEITNEINLFEDYEDNPNRTLIFTYGENPRCYVEGCEILNP